MNNVAITANRIPAMSDAAVANVKKLEDFVLQHEQVAIDTNHVIHGGMYARTIKIPTGTVLTGALIKIPTLLTIYGNCVIYVDGEAKEVSGYGVYAASAHRKQAFVAVTDTYLTMTFPSTAKTVEEAEKQFTDDTDLLMSHSGVNNILITEE